LGIAGVDPKNLGVFGKFTAARDLQEEFFLVYYGYWACPLV
jgi:hypothetical protein